MCVCGGGGGGGGGVVRGKIWVMENERRVGVVCMYGLNKKRRAGIPKV